MVGGGCVRGGAEVGLVPTPWFASQLTELGCLEVSRVLGWIIGDALQDCLASELPEAPLASDLICSFFADPSALEFIESAEQVQFSLKRICWMIAQGGIWISAF